MQTLSYQCSHFVQSVIKFCANIDTSCCTSRVAFIAKTYHHQFTVRVYKKPVYCKSAEKTSKKILNFSPKLLTFGGFFKASLIVLDLRLGFDLGLVDIIIRRPDRSCSPHSRCPGLHCRTSWCRRCVGPCLESSLLPLSCPARRRSWSRYQDDC